MEKNKGQFAQDLSKLKNLWKDRKNQSAYIYWLFSYAKPYMPKIIALMFINLGMSLSSVGMALIGKGIIDRATEHKGSITNLVIIYVACLLASMIVGIASGVISVILNERFSFGIRLQIYKKITESYWMDIQKFHTGDLSTRLTSDAGVISDGIIGVIPGVIKLILEFIVTFFTLFYFSPLIAASSLSVAPVAAFIGLIIGRILKKLQVKVQESESAYRSFMQESLANLLVVKSFSNEGYAANRLSELRDNRFYWIFKRVKMNTVASASMSLAFQTGYVIAFVYGALQVSKNIITFGTMSVFINLVGRIQAPVYGLAQSLPKIAAIMASAGRVMELQDIDIEEHISASMEARQVGFKVDELSFSYSDGDPIFENASMDIKPGEFAAVLGESGIGKTTFIRLLMSLAHCSSGKILFYDEKGETEDAGASSRRFMSYVPQGNSLFSGTIRENLRMGDINATEEEMLEALRLSSGYDFVMNLPKKLDTLIGERGHGLSEGQAQRIAIARAMIKKAPLLILDEATSALDEKTELLVLENLRAIEPKPTCVFITHRQSVIKFCDRVIVIEERRLLDKKVT